MKFFSVLILSLIVQLSSASSLENHPVNPDEGGQYYGTLSAKNILLPITVSSFSKDGRFVAYLTEHKNLKDASTIDYIAHKYDRISNKTISSERIMKNLEKGSAQSIKLAFEGASAESILFTNLSLESTSSSFSGFTISKYSFTNRVVSTYQARAGLGWSISPNGQFLIFIKDGVFQVVDKKSNFNISIPTSYTLPNGNVINFLKPGLLFTHRNINDKGDMILVADIETQALEGASRYYKYNIKTESFIPFKEIVPPEFDTGINGDDEFNKALQLEVNVPLISNDGNYISLLAKNTSGQIVALLINTITAEVLEHELPARKGKRSAIIPRLLTNTGIAQYVILTEGPSNLNNDTVAYYLYDFNNIKVIEHASIELPSSDSNILELKWKMIDQVSLDGQFSIVYDVLMKRTSDKSIPPETSAKLYLKNLSSSNKIEISISPADVIIDPYKAAKSSFNIEVSGTEIYALDVRCNISDTALSINQADYQGVFGDKKSMTLPLINTPSSVTGTETLSAPEQPFSGKGTFIQADVTAEFTTKEVDITCAADVSDINGKLLQVKLTPATIKIDDGVHGGNGSASGSISIPGVTDLSGIKVTLTIDGRQVTVITDKDGRFSFDGLRDGDFVISIASENYVQSCQNTKITEGASVDLGKIELLAGDINADGTIDIADFTFMAARYRSNKGDADYDVKADLNKDGTINIQDLAILGSHFGSTQCNSLPVK